MAEKPQLDVRKLDALIKAFGGNLPVARVGILAKKNTRRAKGTDDDSNATIGMKHEFGLMVPQRSFLRIPLADNLINYLENRSAFTKEFEKVTLKKVIQLKSWTFFMQKIAIVAETIILDAFDSGGFGKWKPSDMTYKKVKQTLVETQQLRNSISSEVVSG